MAVSHTRRPATRINVAMCAMLIAGITIVPQAAGAAQQAAAAEGDCTTHSVPTYVWESSGSGSTTKPRVLHKYMDWGPKSADAVLLDTLYTATLPGTSKIFTGGGHGVLYEATAGGQVKVYKDDTAAGGALLTPVKTHPLDWSGAERIWTNGTRIFVLNGDSTLDIFKQSDPATGAGTITPVAENLRGSWVSELSNADDVWMVNSAIYQLSGDTLKSAPYLEASDATTGVPRILPVHWTTTVATGLTDVKQAWSPGPGAVNTQSVTADPDTTGRIRKFTTGPWTAVDDDVRSGIVGEVMADAGPCLADPDPDVAPYFGTPPDESGGEPATEPPAEPAPAPTPSRTVTGRFLLGDGRPAGGLPVTVTATDTDTDATGQVRAPVLGATTTAADGTWSLVLPETLPPVVREAADGNGGVLNLEAAAVGTTSSGVPMLGVDALTAVTDRPAADDASSPDNGHSVKLAPNTLAADEKDTFDSKTESRTLAARVEADPAPAGEDTPQWQSDHGTLPAGYNPYLVDGKDVSTVPVRAPATPRASEVCDTFKSKQSTTTKYTVVGEAHAGWDARASFEYEGSMNSSFDIAVKSNGDWNISGSRELSRSIGVSVGYYNKGPHYARQYKVPIEYIKWKKQRFCYGTVRATWYTIEANRYKAPAGGALGKVGKDVSGRDGSANFNRSPKAYRNYLNPGDTAQLSRGRSVKFGSAVSAFGVSLGAKTGYDSNHRQRITAGNRSGKHWIWGRNGAISSGKAGVFYSK